MPFCTAGMYCRGIAPPTIESTNSKPSPRLERARRAGWRPRTGRGRRICFLTLPSASAWPAIVSRYGHPHVLGLDVDAELAGQPLERDGEVGVADAAQHGLVGLLVALDAQRRVLGLQALQRAAELVVVGLRAAADGEAEDGRWRRAGRRPAPACPSAPACRRCGCRPAWRRRRCRRRRPRGGGRLLLAAQVEQAVQPLLGAAGGVDEVVVGLDRAGQHLEQRELADERVGDRLEHEGQRLAAGVGGDVDLLSPASTVTGRSAGDGPISQMKSASRSTPTPVSAEPKQHRELRARRAPRGRACARARRPSGTSPDRYRSSCSSSPETISSTSSSCDAVLLVGDVGRQRLGVVRAVGLVLEGLIGEHVGDAVERGLLAERQLERREARAERRPGAGRARGGSRRAPCPPC